MPLFTQITRAQARLFCYLMYYVACMNRSFWLLLLVGALLVAPQVTFAIPPPDIIVNLGSQLAQIFSLLVVLFSVAAGAILQISHRVFTKVKGFGIWSGLAAFGVVVFSLSISYVVLATYQNVKYQEYVNETINIISKGIDEHDVLPGPDGDALSDFFENNQGLPLAISNEEFEANRLSMNPFVLDAREVEEYDIGHYPDVHHIRFADLVAGKWTELPTDEVVYVFCWSGMRGQELAEFLREKGIVSRYLEEGASGWVEDGGIWEGGIKFTSVYSEDRYTGTLSTAETHEFANQGAVLVDARRQDAYAKSHIEGSINITIFFTPTDVLEQLFVEIPPNSKVITICDNYISCFDAKILGVKLEKLGHTFLGRYNKPWDY